MKSLIDIWKENKDAQKKKNTKFVRKLKKHNGKHLDKFTAKIHDKVFEKIDCINCAGCCKGIPPIINKNDCSRIAKKLGISVSEFQNNYLTIDEDNDTVMNTSPCVFLLENNKCSIYEFRPKACKEYPHTNINFSKNLNYHATNSMYCPATFHILEALKKSVPV
ncbi:MAG: YkgJ family cysteine cluster protein [Saprospiraceae bacterium]|nr:YkgJ family cysteine cluster protein [Saprospiraceae bacterium]